MPTVAEQLRTAREQHQMTQHQLADITKIRTDHIAALEEGNYNVFSAPVYIRGFVRTCASVLHLDVPAVLATLDEELGQTKKFREPPRLSGESRGIIDAIAYQLSKINWRIALPLVAVTIVVVASITIYRGVRSYKARDPLSGLGAGIYQPTTPSRGEIIPLPGTNSAPVRR
ncbi:MAG: helix-turn-helix domain-containing protein [Verrucomicrobiota bacterium]|nr:helix-turn-helix domain-containing protein [Verrucomicrobiota bacterium]